MIKHLLQIVRQIGRWLLRRFGEYGRVKLTHYMEARIDVFRDRLGRARTKSRKNWLRGRIRRWNRAVAWLKSEGKRLTRKLADRLAGELERAGKYAVGTGEKMVRRRLARA